MIDSLFTSQPDRVLVDLDMKGVDGIATTRQIIRPIQERLVARGSNSRPWGYECQARRRVNLYPINKKGGFPKTT